MDIEFIISWAIHQIIKIFESIVVVDIHRDFFIAVSAGVFVLILTQFTIMGNHWYRYNKIRNFISNDITKMFQDIGTYTSVKDYPVRKSFSTMKEDIFFSRIKDLKEITRMNAGDLKPEQSAKLITSLNNVESYMRIVKNTHIYPKNEHYSEALRDFKRIKWLKIPLERIDCGAE